VHLRSKVGPFSFINFIIAHNFNNLVALIDLGYSSHAFHSSNRLVFMTAKLGAKSGRAQKMVIRTPPNNRVFPPGPGANKVYHPRILSHTEIKQSAYVYLTVDDVTSAGVRVMVGDGRPPPVKDQGIPL